MGRQSSIAACVAGLSAIFWHDPVRAGAGHDFMGVWTGFDASLSSQYGYGGAAYAFSNDIDSDGLIARIGLGGADTIFLLYGGIVLAIRVFGARLQDRLGSVRAGFMALSGIAGGMIVIASWGTVTGLYVGTVVYALGAALLYPAILLLALARASDQERASVVGTVSSFFDLSQGLGSLIIGAVVSAAGYRGGFAFGAGCALVAIVILRTATRRSRTESSEPSPEASGELAHASERPRGGYPAEQRGGAQAARRRRRRERKSGVQRGRALADVAQGSSRTSTSSGGACRRRVPPS